MYILIHTCNNNNNKFVMDEIFHKKWSNKQMMEIKHKKKLKKICKNKKHLKEKLILKLKTSNELKLKTKNYMFISAKHLKLYVSLKVCLHF